MTLYSTTIPFDSKLAPRDQSNYQSPMEGRFLSHKPDTALKHPILLQSFDDLLFDAFFLCKGQLDHFCIELII